MADDLLLLLAGFALTTVAGGLLGYWLQNRSWQRQQRHRLEVAQMDAARAFYEELSHLLDRRLHRMRELDGWLERPEQTREIDRRLSRYRDVLDEWNDNLNRNLALAIRYFGVHTHAVLEDLYRKFSTAGSRIEGRFREYDADGKTSSPPVAGELRQLDLVIYDLNLAMIQALQNGSVGVSEAEDGAAVERRGVGPSLSGAFSRLTSRGD
jgi:hypothetical protein